MSEYAEGGIVRGDSHEVLLVSWPSPTGEADPDVIFSDECIISHRGFCTRRDDAHANGPITEQGRWWICPTHDGAGLS